MAEMRSSEHQRVYITVADLPAALAARGICNVSKRKAESIASRRRLPFFRSPLDGRLVITPQQLDEALLAPAAKATREWSARKSAQDQPGPLQRPRRGRKS
jgi:hypothetical protein